MYWWRPAAILLLLTAAVTAQRGSRRYRPDQPQEESLSTENHRFRSRTRDETGEIPTEGGRRGTLSQTETNQRLSPGASRSSRGRTEEPRQYHSIPRRREQQHREEKPSTEGVKQYHSRREPERTRQTEPQDQRYRSRDGSGEITESSRVNSRGRTRGEVPSGKRTPATVTRFPSRGLQSDTDTQGANLEPVRNRAGSRTRTPTLTRNIPSRNTIPKPLPTPSTDRILSRADVGDQELIQTGSQDLASENKFTADPFGTIELPTKINDVTENNQELPIAEGESTKVNNKDTESKIDTVLNEGIDNEESKSIALSKTVTTPYENVIEYPSNLNDVEESNRASRRLDTDITDSQQVTRGRTRSSEVNGRRRIPNDSRKGRGESHDRTLTRGRGSEIKGRNSDEELHETRTRSRPSEEQIETRSRKISPSRTSRLEGSVRSHTSEEHSRNREQDGRSRSELTRSSRLEASSRNRANSDDTSRSKNIDNKGKQNVESKSRMIPEDAERNQNIGNRQNPEIQGSIRNTEVRSRRPSTESFSTNDSKRRPDKNFLVQRERTPEVAKKDTNGVRSTHRYSAKIPDASQFRPEQKPGNSLISRGRTKDLPNFRTRPKSNENIGSSEEKLDVTPTSASLPEVQTGRKTLLNNYQEEKNEVILNSSTERIVAPTIKSLASLLHRKPGGNRPRGAAKGPKLEEQPSSGEVRDDDNYPEVYKQLKKSGTSPKEILALLKARKATQGKLDSSKPKFTQPDASLKSSGREQKPNSEEIKTSPEEDEYKRHSQNRFRSRNRETGDNFNQKLKSKLPSRKNEKIDVPSNIKDLETKSRFRPSIPRPQTEFNQKKEKFYKKSEELNDAKLKPEREKSNERKYLPPKRFEYQTLNRKKPTTFVSTETAVQQDSPLLEPDGIVEEEKITDFDDRQENTPEDRRENTLDDQIIQSLKEDYTIHRQNTPKLELLTSEIPVDEDQTDKSKKSYTPRNREKEFERFKARTEKTFDFVSVETPIKPNYKLYNRNDGTTFRRRSFTTPTLEGEDLTVNKELKNSLRPRNRPTYVPPKKSYTKQVTTPIPLSRYRARKASLSKFNNKEVLKVDNSEDHKLTFNSEVDDHEDLRPRFNDLSVDSLVSESEHATYTTEPSIAKQKTTRDRSKYKESFIQRIPPRGKAMYTRPTFRPSTSFRPEPTTLGLESLTSPDFITENEIFSSTSSYTLDAAPTVDDFTPSVTITEATTLEMTTGMPTTTTSTTTKPTTTTRKITTTHRTTKHTTKKPTMTKPTTKKATTTTRLTTTTTPRPTTTTTTRPTTTTTQPTTTTTTTTQPTTTTTQPTTTTTQPTTTTSEPTTIPTTTKLTTTPTTTTILTTKKTKATTTKRKLTTTRKPTTTTRKPTTTTTKKPTTTTKPSTTTRKATTTSQKPSTTTRKLITTKVTTIPTTMLTTSVHTAIPRKVGKSSTISTPISSTLNSILSTKQPNFLSTVAYLAHDFSVTPTDYNPVNTADFRTTSRPTESTTAMSNSEHYVVYGLLPNNNVVRKVVKTTKAPIDLPFIIYGLYPNGTIVRRFPNGTIIPDETEEENEVIGNVDPDSHEELEDVVKKDSPLAYLYPPGMERPPSQNSLTAKLSEEPSSTTSPTTIQTSPSTKPTTTTKPTTKPTTKSTTVKKKNVPTATTKKPHTTTKKLTTTTKKPTTTTKKPVATTTKKPATTTTKKPATATTKKLATTTNKPTTTTTKITSTTTTTKSATATSKIPTPTTTRKSSAITTKSTSTTVITPSTKKPNSTIGQYTGTKLGLNKSTTKGDATTVSTTTQKSKKSKTTKSSTTTVSPNEKKQTLPTPMIIYAETSSDATTSKEKISTKATTPLSDIEIISNLLSQGLDAKLLSGTTESSEDLANKVIQLAIERAQNSTEPSESKGGSTSSSDLQSLSSSVSPIVKEDYGVGETKNKTGKISLWVIPPDESTTGNGLEAPVSKSNEAVLNSLLSTPSTLENLSLSDQLLLADVLSSTTFPQTTTKKKKKKRPKTTTTTTQSPFPVLQYLFGRNRGGGGGLFQRGLFRGGGLGGLAALQAGSSPQVQESPGGIFQNQNDEFPKEQIEIPAETETQERPQEGARLVNAAINVSRAVSQFMGFVIQGAAQSFQNYLQTRTRALAEAIAYPPAQN